MRERRLLGLIDRFRPRKLANDNNQALKIAYDLLCLPNFVDHKADIMPFVIPN